MFEFIMIVLFLFVFVYSKNRADQLRDQIDSLRTKLDSGARSAENSAVEPNNSTADTLSEAVPVSRVFEPVAEKPWIKPEPESEPAVLAETRQPEETGLVMAEVKKQSDDDLEFKLGSKVFTAVGVVAVIFAVGFSCVTLSKII